MAEDIYERAEAALDAAAVHFTTEKAKLFRADGAPVYADAVYDEKVAALTARLHAVAEQALGLRGAGKRRYGRGGTHASQGEIRSLVP